MRKQKEETERKVGGVGRGMSWGGLKSFGTEEGRASYQSITRNEFFPIFHYLQKDKQHKQRYSLCEDR